METEAYSSAKCSRFATRARMHDNHELARLLEETADVDSCRHFQEEFTAAGLLGKDLDNVTAAMDERLRQTDMYSEFQAALPGRDNAAAALFGNIDNDELSQLDAFQLSIAMMKTTAGVPA